jgi:hypothetical protein
LEITKSVLYTVDSLCYNIARDYENYRNKGNFKINNIDFPKILRFIFIKYIYKKKSLYVKVYPTTTSYWIMMVGASDCLRGPQTRGAPWDFPHLVIWSVRPSSWVQHTIWLFLNEGECQTTGCWYHALVVRTMQQLWALAATNFLALQCRWIFITLAFQWVPNPDFWKGYIMCFILHQILKQYLLSFSHFQFLLLIVTFQLYSYWYGEIHRDETYIHSAIFILKSKQ